MKKKHQRESKKKFINFSKACSSKIARNSKTFTHKKNSIAG